MSTFAQESVKSWKQAAGRPRKPAASLLAAIFVLARKTAVNGVMLLVRTSNAYAEARMQRAMIEVQLYRRHYRHSSKNDDELPMVDPAPAEQRMPVAFPRAALRQAAGAVVETAKRIYPAVVVLSFLALALAATILLRLAIWLPLYGH